jgi:hypothetical protein
MIIEFAPEPSRLGDLSGMGDNAVAASDQSLGQTQADAAGDAYYYNCFPSLCSF